MIMKRKRKNKMVKMIFVLVLFIFPVSLLLKSLLSNVNMEVEELKRQINVENNKIECLTMKIDELKSLANIYDTIESEGLGYNSTNIKVLTKN